MASAYLFPGQGAQFVGMGKALYDSNPKAKVLFETANELLGFRLTDIMFEGTPAALQATQITQPAIFLHSVILAKTTSSFKPDMIAGHSLGELSALVACQAINFEDGLTLVQQRAEAMQRACEQAPGSMAAILGIHAEAVEQACHTIHEVVVPANYNCPGQTVIAGTHKGVTLACEILEKMGAKKIVMLPVSGAFHSPIMELATEKFAQAIARTKFQEGMCPIYQNVNARPSTNPAVIKENLIQQLVAPVRWEETIQRMIQDGAQHFTAYGPGSILQGFLRRIDNMVSTSTIG